MLDNVPASPQSLVEWMPPVARPWQGVAPSALIATPSGARSIGMLETGDLVLLTHSVHSGRVALIAEHIVDVTRQPEAEPIFVLADALGDRCPVRTTELAPDTLLDVDGLLVPVAALVNGISVLRFGAVQSARYVALETEDHGIVEVNGLRVATFLASDRACRPVADASGIARARTVVNARIGLFSDGDRARC